MSEHPELREALRATVSSSRHRWLDYVDDCDPIGELDELDRTLDQAVADALLAGPVGKLQVELAYEHSMSAYYRLKVHDQRAVVADLRRRLNEAERRSIEASNPGIDMDEVRRFRAAGESAVTGDGGQ